MDALPTVFSFFLPSRFFVFVFVSDADFDLYTYMLLNTHSRQSLRDEEVFLSSLRTEMG